MSDEPRAYKDGRALWEAAAYRSRTQAAASGDDAGALLRRFVFDRLLARVFVNPTSPWVLKGGNAVLVRVHDARTTKDLDLLHRLADIDAAVEALRLVASTDMDDHFRFFITKVDKDASGMAQPNVAGAKVYVDAYAGAQKVHSFHVDIVTGSLMTAAPETRLANSVDVPGITAPTLRLYPVVDHVADKLCAIQALYGTNNDEPSSRYRDLVDLVVFALTQDLDGDDLATAISGEWMHRKMVGEPRFEPPTEFARAYPPLARKVPRCAGYTVYTDAVALVSTMLAPALDGTAAGRRWVAARTTWQQGPALAVTSPANPPGQR